MRSFLTLSYKSLSEVLGKNLPSLKAMGNFSVISNESDFYVACLVL